MTWFPAGITKSRNKWKVHAQSDTGESQELKCVTEGQARYYAAVLELGPSSLPQASLNIRRKLAKLKAP